MTIPTPRISRTALLATVSAVALTLAWGPEGQAADMLYPAAETPYEPARSDAGPYVWLSLEGRYNIYDGRIFDEEGDSTYGDPDHGWSGGLELGVRPAGGPWDFVGRLIYGHAEGSDDPGDPFTRPIDGDEDSIIADFEVGRHVGVGLLGGNTRIHAGLRFVHFDATVSSELYFYNPVPTTIPFHQRQTITAVGPRIGVDQTIPLASNVSVELSAAGAALFGTRDREFFAYYSENGSEPVTVWNAEASAGLTYDFGTAAMTLGYRVDAFWDLYLPPDGAASNDRITHGPFAKLTVDLGGGN